MELNFAIARPHKASCRIDRVRYNSVIFKAIDSNDYYTLTVNEGFLSGVPFDPNTWSRYANVTVARSLQQSVASLEHLDNQKCISEYSQPFLSGRQDLILVTTDTTHDYSTTSNGRLLDFVQVNQNEDNKMLGSNTPEWICSSLPGFTGTVDKQCSASILDANAWRVNGYNIGYCRSELVPQRCQLQFSQPIAICVILCNVIKVSCMVIAAFKLEDETLCTLG